MKYKVSGIVAVEIEADDVRDAMTKVSAAKKKDIVWVQVDEIKRKEGQK